MMDANLRMGLILKQRMTRFIKWQVPQSTKVPARKTRPAAMSWATSRLVHTSWLVQSFIMRRRPERLQTTQPSTCWSRCCAAKVTCIVQPADTYRYFDGQSYLFDKPFLAWFLAGCRPILLWECHVMQRIDVAFSHICCWQWLRVPIASICYAPHTLSICSEFFLSSPFRCACSAVCGGLPSYSYVNGTVYSSIQCTVHSQNHTEHKKSAYRTSYIYIYTVYAQIVEDRVETVQCDRVHSVCCIQCVRWLSNHRRRHSLYII